MPDFTLPAVLMQDGKFWKLNAPTLIGEQDEIIKRMSAEIPTNLLSAFILPGGRPAHIQIKGDLIICWTELKSLKINTVYSITADGSRYPLFKNAVENSPPEYEAGYEFCPELANMRMFFTSTIKKSGGSYVWAQSCLVCKAPKRREIFRPPLPNIHSDSKLCMGNLYSSTGPCLADVFTHSLAHLESSKWNSDAMQGLTGDHIRALYSFKFDKQIPPVAGYKWWENPSCAPVNNLNYGELPLV